MGNLITASGFEKSFQYIEHFKHGLIVTVLLAFFTVVFGFICFFPATFVKSQYKIYGVDKKCIEFY